MVVKVSGKIDGKEVIFERAEGDRWNVTVPYDLDGMYVVELTAENDAGNIAYCTKMLLIVDPATLCSSYRRARSALCGGNLSDTRKGVLL